MSNSASINPGNTITDIDVNRLWGKGSVRCHEYLYIFRVGYRGDQQIAQWKNCDGSQKDSRTEPHFHQFRYCAVLLMCLRCWLMRKEENTKYDKCYQSSRCRISAQLQTTLTNWLIQIVADHCAKRPSQNERGPKQCHV